MCPLCGVNVSVTAGTIFHGSHTPLSTWFAAVWFVCSQENGVSALGLQRVLGFGSYETAGAWLHKLGGGVGCRRRRTGVHKLRRAMVRPERDRLAGVVEVDQSFLGGRATGQLGAATDKVPVMIAVERVDQRRIGRIRLEVAEAPGTLERVDLACEVAQPGATIRTDGARMFRRLAGLGYTHQPVAGYNAPDIKAVLPGVHLVSSLLKRWAAGTLHHAISDRHLPYYLDEFTFRFNRRNSRARGMLFYRLLLQAVETDPHPLTELIHGPRW